MLNPGFTWTLGTVSGIVPPVEKALALSAELRGPVAGILRPGGLGLGLGQGAGKIRGSTDAGRRGQGYIPPTRAAGPGMVQSWPARAQHAPTHNEYGSDDPAHHP